METGISRRKRDLPPAHYKLKIKSYSLLLQSEAEKYDSGVFETGGHKWSLSLYPNGNKKSNGNGYISLYLVIEETDTYPHGWEVLVDLKLFVFDQILDKYLTIQDADGAFRRFNEMNTEWGFGQLISEEIFNNSSNGYLVNDSCLFGAEVCVINHTHTWESLSMVKKPLNGTFTWKLENFSTLNKTSYVSPTFSVGERNWFLTVYPKGNGTANGVSLSIFLECEDIPANRAIYADYILRILGTLKRKKEHSSDKHWFSASSKNWGFVSFISLKELNNASNGFIVNDTITIEVEILVLSEIKVFRSENIEEA
ncbi:MATH domain and coiled-coil domain-containing protein At3g58370 isoform X1 [Ziziphus jujuba]|uniref:MATH domain and coiled-coil domain-containing protein At3g58370 isoform X1 n=1 Tax=Ziziphus jujuba TaxID=326968 RepID=A0ABM3IU12_ZIZJJ|nr:MATH domain and coiled-coil domain-containing protein At3g58370 isoform X1 [Ziziphus jujuba]